MARADRKKSWGIRVVVILILIGLVAGFLLLRQKSQPSSARIALPDGTSARVLAVTYGTNHVVGTKLAKFMVFLPATIQKGLRSVFGRYAIPVQSTTTPTPELLVWLDRQPPRQGVTAPGAGYFMAYLGDGSNFVSGANATVNNYMPGFETEAVHFHTFPRRDRQITLNIYDHNASGIDRLGGSLAFANPQYRKYPEWTAEPLPARQRAGDVEVTLERVETGHGNGSTVTYDDHGGHTVEYNTDRSDGENHTAVYLKLRPLVNTNEVWQVAGAELADATGNRVPSSSMSWSGGISSFEFAPSLWPGEAAWKLKLEVKRTEGFRPEEIFTFRNVPLGELDRTNAVGWSTNVAGVTVTLQSIFRRAPMTNNSWSSSLMSNVRVKLSPFPAGTQLDLLRMVSDTGKTNHSDSWSSGGNEREYSYRDIQADARTADFTFAIQQSQTVEFTVKPELPQVKPKSNNNR